MKSLVVLATACALLSGCSGSTSATPKVSKAVEVRYEVLGTVKSAHVTIETATGTSQQDVAVPIINKAGGRGLTVMLKPGSFAYISAQNQDEYGSGPIKCMIVADGVSVSENSSTGQFAIATCKATV